MRRPHLRAFLLCVPVLSAVVVSALTLTTAPADAHPFGEPQSLQVSADPAGVRVTWSAAPDDVTALAAHLGVVGGQHLVVFEDGEFDAEASSVPAGVRLAEHGDVLAAYLNDRITVLADGERCRGELERVENVARDGATLVFDCGGEVAVAEIAVETLTDIHPSYRTLAQGPRGQRHAYSRGGEAVSWQLGAGDELSAEGSAELSAELSAGRSAALQLGSIVAVFVVAGVAWWLTMRRRRAR